MLQTIISLLTHFGTLVGFAVGITVGAVIGWIARGYYKKKKGTKEEGGEDVFAVLTSTVVISLWALAHLNNVFFGGAEVNWILNIIGGLAVSSLIQEKDSFIKIIGALRGGNQK